MSDELKPSSEVRQAKQDEEAQFQRRMRWLWAEQSVWTDRMLMALENGVKGGVWFSLIDKVYNEENLRTSYDQVAKNKGAAGVDHVDIERYGKQLDSNIEQMQQQLREGTYRPQAIRRVWIPKPGSTEQRPLGIPTVQDRVIQAAVRNVIEPIFERDFAKHSYGFRPGRGCKDALREVDKLLKEGYRYVMDADLKGYFDTIPHDQLIQLMSKKVADSRVLGLVMQFLKSDVMDGTELRKTIQGSPQGGVISPLLSNIYLDPLDHKMEELGYKMVRYADDFVILCRTKGEAEGALRIVQEWVEAAGLTLHPTKTRIVFEEKEGFDFLGYHFRRGKRWPRVKSKQKLRDAIRLKTKRTSGKSLLAIIADVNRTLNGWYEYFKHSKKDAFVAYDGWIRGRLRNILKRRDGRRGIAKGADHQKWPISFFDNLGLMNLTTTRVKASVPSG